MDTALQKKLSDELQRSSDLRAVCEDLRSKLNDAERGRVSMAASQEGTAVREEGAKWSVPNPDTAARELEDAKSELRSIRYMKAAVEAMPDEDMKAASRVELLKAETRAKAIAKEAAKYANPACTPKVSGLMLAKVHRNITTTSVQSRLWKCVLAWISNIQAELESVAGQEIEATLISVADSAQVAMGQVALHQQKSPSG